MNISPINVNNTNYNKKYTQPSFGNFIALKLPYKKLHGTESVVSGFDRIANELTHEVKELTGGELNIYRRKNIFKDAVLGFLFPASKVECSRIMLIEDNNGMYFAKLLTAAKSLAKKGFNYKYVAEDLFADVAPSNLAKYAKSALPQDIVKQ